MKLRTSNDLYDLLDRELSWRKKELITLKLLVDRSRDHQGTLLRRAGVALLYAHFEGFVKNAGEAYVEYVSRQNIQVKSLSANFLAMALKPYFHAASVSDKYASLIRGALFVKNELHKTAKVLWKDAVQTQSNLNRERFRDITSLLGLNNAKFAAKEKPVIDRVLVQRNKIAHGQHFDVDSKEYNTLHIAILEIIDDYRDEIIRCASNKSFEG